jgi:hypothetical protein
MSVANDQRYNSRQMTRDTRDEIYTRRPVCCVVVVRALGEITPKHDEKPERA